MFKKVLSALFFLGAILMLIGAIANGTLFTDRGSAAATYGFFLGLMIPIILYVLSGIFLFTFDSATKLNYIDGFKKRSKQCSKLLFFIAAYVILIFFASMGIDKFYDDNIVFIFIVIIVENLPYFIPMTIFLIMLLMYALPHWTSKKYFLGNEAVLDEYLSVNETFYTFSDDNYVLASKKALFFPELFCVVPFSEISSISLTKQLWEQDVYFHLTNGKKFYIVTKHYDHIMEAMNACNQIQ